MAALTAAISQVNTQFQALSFGGLNARLVKLTFDSGTDAGGAVFTAANVGLSEFFIVVLSIDAGDNGSVVGAGFVPQYNYVTGKVQFFQEGANTNDPLEEVDSSLADVVVRALCIGI